MVAAGQHSERNPVYGVGEEDGVHFYAMQFIDGEPLSRAIDTLREHQTPAPTAAIGSEPVQCFKLSPTVLCGSESLASGVARPEALRRACESATTDSATPFDDSGRATQANPLASASPSERFHRVAQMGIQVADALDYAHQHGLLHRDIKPANLMLDRDGNVWVADFGLVKLADEEDLTGTNDLVGTLRDMAPEQFDGRAAATSATDDSLERSLAVLNEAITDFESYLSKTPNSSRPNQQTRSKLYDSLAETLTRPKRDSAAAAARRQAEDHRESQRSPERQPPREPRPLDRQYATNSRSFQLVLTSPTGLVDSAPTSVGD